LRFAKYQAEEADSLSRRRNISIHPERESKKCKESGFSVNKFMPMP